MNSEFIAMLEYLEREKGISREVLIDAVSGALLQASKRSVGPARDLRIDIDRKTGDIRALANLTAVENVVDPYGEIELSKVRRKFPDAQLGDAIDWEVTPSNFGRIAATTARQVISQRLRQAEKELIYAEFKDRAGDIVTGTIRRFERSDVIIDLGKFEATMPQRERVATEDYAVGDRIRAYVTAVENGPRGPEIILSRSHPNFVKRLFEVEVSEIADRTVELRAIAREAGFRTKVAVWSADEKVDPVGACVGMRGSRVRNIVRELNNEKIDIIRWSSDPKEFVTEALKPAKAKSVTVDKEKRKVLVLVDETELSIAIGKRGQNARLTSRLTGWDVTVEKAPTGEQTFANQVAEAAKAIQTKYGLDEATADLFIRNGFREAEVLLGANAAEVAEALSISVERAEEILRITREETATEVSPINETSSPAH